MTFYASDIKRIRSLKEKKFRDELSLFVVEGEKMVQEALQSNFVVENVIKASEVGNQVMNKISMLSSPSPVLAVVRKPQNLGDVPALKKDGLYLALDGIRDPGNMGTILRIADWFGVDAVFASVDSVDIFNPKVVQSTMGAIFRVDFHYCDIASLCAREDTLSFGTFLKGDDIYTSDLSSSLARIIVTGNEANGISDNVAKLCKRRITIPSFSRGVGSESLNAAVATAITVSEFKRR